MDGDVVMGQTGQDLSLESRQRIVRMSERGASNSEIAEAMGITTDTVRLWVRRWQAGQGLGNRIGNRAGRQRDLERERRICELRRAGMRAGEIAAEVGMHPTSVTRILNESGLGLMLEPVPITAVMG